MARAQARCVAWTGCLPATWLVRQEAAIRVGGAGCWGPMHPSLLAAQAHTFEGSACMAGLAGQWCALNTRDVTPLPCNTLHAPSTFPHFHVKAPIPYH